MFYVKSYIKNPVTNILNHDDLLNNSELFFIEVDHINSNSEYFNLIDPNYLEGAIVLKYYNDIIIDFRYWDLIDQLWSYLVNMIEDISTNEIFECYLPDQPVKISLKKTSNNYVVFSVDINKWNLEKDSFFKCVLEGAETFFYKMHLCFNSNAKHYLDELERIKCLKKDGGYGCYY